MPEEIDLDAYLARIGLKSRPAADPEGLAAVQRAHRLSIPFENLDVILGRGISLDPGAIFDKLVTRRRGGYCFEQNGLFGDALAALGFTTRPLLARVWLGATETPPRTHTLNLVTIEGTSWIADAGFGGSYSLPMPLAEGEALGPDGARHCLSRDGVHGWVLDRLGNPATTDGRGAEQGWVRQYSFTTDPVWPADLAQANHFTATVPGGRFTSCVVASMVLPNGFASLVDRAYSRTSASGTEQSEITSEKMLRLRLSLMFGIDLTTEEVAALGLFPA